MVGEKKKNIAHTLSEILRDRTVRHSCYSYNNASDPGIAMLLKNTA